MLETHIVMSSLISHLVLILVFRLAFTLMLLLALFSRALPHFSHGPNHRSYGFGPRENRLEPRRFGYGPHTHRGDHFPCRSGFPAGESFTHFEPRHLEGPRFPRRGSRPTRPSGEV
jgi:hypothetical protein